MKKVIVIGLDGFEPRLLEKWIDYLPNLKFLVENGVYSRLRSTTPPNSAPAWTTFSTGKHPWNHGIHDFFHPNGNIVCSKDVMSARIWNYLNIEGMKTGVINIPITYPPEKVNGFMISSLLTPPSAKNHTWPPNIKNKIPNPNRPHFKLSIEKIITSEKNLNEIIEDVYKTTEKVKENIIYLIEKEKWDFFAFNLRGTDVIAHKCWHLMDDKHPLFTKELNQRFGNVILKYYKYIDGVIGEIIEKLPEETNKIVISDHGQGSNVTSEYSFIQSKKIKWLKVFLKSSFLRKKQLIKKMLEKVKKNTEIIPKNPLNSGTHKPFGVLIAQGPDIKKGKIKNAEIMDLTPTILHLMGLKVPKDIDGKVLINIFKSDSNPMKRKIHYCKPIEYEIEWYEDDEIDKN